MKHLQIFTLSIFSIILICCVCYFVGSKNSKFRRTKLHKFDVSPDKQEKTTGSDLEDHAAQSWTYEDYLSQST
jgi:hypothetical protein